MQGARFRQTQEPTSPCLVTRKYPRLTNCMADRVPDSAVSFTWEVFQAARKPVSEAHNTQEYRTSRLKGQVIPTIASLLISCSVTARLTDPST
jgi:hypothetical protein